MLVLLLALNIYCFKGVYPLLFLLFIFVYLLFRRIGKMLFLLL